MAVEVLLGQAWDVGVCRLVVAGIAVEQPFAVGLHRLISCRVDRPVGLASICVISVRMAYRTSDALKYLLHDDIDERSPLGSRFTTGTRGRPKGVTYTHNRHWRRHGVGPGRLHLRDGADVSRQLFWPAARFNR